MASGSSFSKEEESRNLHRMLRVFACKQEDSMEDREGGEMTPPADRTWEDTEEAFGQTTKGT